MSYLAAAVTILIILMIIIGPLVFLINAFIQEIQNIDQYRGAILSGVDTLDNYFPGTDLRSFVRAQLSEIGVFFRNLALNSLQGAANMLISAVILFFALYYSLINYDMMEKKMLSIIPFNKKNSCKLISEFKETTHAVIIVTGLIALFQGGLLGLSFFFFGIPGAFFWGVVSFILSFLPVVGIPIVWVPTALIYLLREDFFTGIGIFIIGIILSNVDNLIRPWLQQRIGKINPMITLLGVFMGIAFFGIIGLVIGPLLLSYFLLSVKFFSEEYL